MCRDTVVRFNCIRVRDILLLILGGQPGGGMMVAKDKAPIPPALRTLYTDTYSVHEPLCVHTPLMAQACRASWLF